MTDLQGLSSNILLIGFVLVGIASLYLLYSNYKKTQELEDLQIQVRVLKDVFTTSQKNYLELRDNVLSSLHDNSTTKTNLTTESRPVDVHEIVLSSVSKESNDIKTIKVHQQDLITTVLNSNVDNSVKEKIDIKKIEIVDDDVNADMNDLKELDDLDNPQESDNTDELNEYSNDDNTIDLGNVDEIKEYILDPIHSFKDNDETDLDIEDIIDDMVDEDTLDTKSIQTDPNDNELNDLDIDLEDLQTHMDDNTTHIDTDIDTDDMIKTIKVDNDIDILTTILKSNDQKSDNSKSIILDLELDLNNTPLNIEIKKSDDTNSISLDQLLNNKGNDNVDLNSMSVKQLKELAKQKKIKTVGTKQELIQALQHV